MLPNIEEVAESQGGINLKYMTAKYPARAKYRLIKNTPVAIDGVFFQVVRTSSEKVSR